MKRTILFLLLSFLLCCLTACSSVVYQDNQVYIVEQGGNMDEDTVVGWLDINGTSPFQTENLYQQQLIQGQFFLTASADGKQIFYEEFLPEQDSSVLIGPGKMQVNLYMFDQTDQTARLIAANRPFIAKADWNQEKKMVAFSGDGVLTVYDLDKQKTMLDEDLAAETVTSFFWSPLESRKLYLEQPRNAIGSLYYMEPQKKAELYETAERIYYKAQLDESYFYGTRWSMDQDKHEAIYTVLANANKEAVKVIGEGSYRDHYLRSVLLSGENNFGLTYIANINQVSKSVQLTKDYVYDAKFIADGRSIYVTASKNRTKNQYILHLINTSGEEIKQWKISGCNVLLSEDGKIGYVGGTKQEVLTFVQPSIKQSVDSGSADKLETALCGAGSVYAQLLLGQIVSQEEKEQFYANLEGLEQIHKEPFKDETQISFSIHLLAIEENEAGKLCTIQIIGLNNTQQQIQQKILFQMIEQNQNWYVLDFETGETSEDA